MKILIMEIYLLSFIVKIPKGLNCQHFVVYFAEQQTSFTELSSKF